MQDIPHKSAFVSIIGKPNVGKSTLLNQLLKTKLSVTNPKAQTTRHRIRGILSEDNYQIVFSDTPGIIKPVYKLQQSMMLAVEETFEDSDLVLLVEEVKFNPQDIDPQLVLRLQQFNSNLIVLLNKIDEYDQSFVGAQLQAWSAAFDQAKILPISALHGFNTDILLKLILEKAPEGPAYFAKEDLSDRNDRFFVQEIVREKILVHYKEEIPYSVEVVVDTFVEKPQIAEIAVIIYVNRDSQKGILIGKQGRAMKRMATDARKAIEAFLGTKVFLQTHVKVRKNWRDDENALKSFGYAAS